MAIRIKLKPGRERSLDRRHPWIFSNGIHNINGGKPAAGDTVGPSTKKKPSMPTSSQDA
jgi:23S rRNA (cytosine1962-C5)-methyltransferase